MTEIPPQPNPQQAPSQPSQKQNIQQHDDARDLNLLAIFYYIMAGLQALGACCLIIHLVVGVVMAGLGVAEQEEGAVIFGVFFMGFALVIMAIFWLIAFVLYLTGRNLKRHESPTFCFVVAIISCMNFPFGTALGVFTIIVLNRPSVKALFAARKDQPYSEEYLQQWK